MKRFFGFALMLGLLSIPAFAAKDSQKVLLPNPVKVGSTQLAAGNYDFSWTGTGTAAQVSIKLHGKTIATVPAKVVQSKSSQISLSTDTAGGVDVLQSVQLHNVNLIFTGATPSGE